MDNLPTVDVWPADDGYLTSNRGPVDSWHNVVYRINDESVMTDPFGKRVLVAAELLSKLGSDEWRFASYKDDVLTLHVDHYGALDGPPHTCRYRLVGKVRWADMEEQATDLLMAELIA